MKFEAPKPVWYELEVKEFDSEPLRETYHKICDLMEQIIKEAIKESK